MRREEIIIAIKKSKPIVHMLIGININSIIPVTDEPHLLNERTIDERWSKLAKLELWKNQFKSEVRKREFNLALQG